MNYNFPFPDVFTNPELADPIVHRAYVVAEAAHRDQKRRYTNDDYIVHPLDVAGIVYSACGFHREVLAAALLHDVVEDTDVGLADIEAEFGPEVAGYVSCVTNVSRPEHGNRSVRKAMDLAHLQRATPNAQTIKLADILANVPSIVQHDPKFAAVYVAEKREALRVLREGHPELLARANALLRVR